MNNISRCGTFDPTSGKVFEALIEIEAEKNELLAIGFTEGQATEYQNYLNKLCQITRGGHTERMALSKVFKRIVIYQHISADDAVILTTSQLLKSCNPFVITEPTPECINNVLAIIIKEITL